MMPMAGWESSRGNSRRFAWCDWTPCERRAATSSAATARESRPRIGGRVNVRVPLACHQVGGLRCRQRGLAFDRTGRLGERQHHARIGTGRSGPVEVSRGRRTAQARIGDLVLEHIGLLVQPASARPLPRVMLGGTSLAAFMLPLKLAVSDLDIIPHPARAMVVAPATRVMRKSVPYRVMSDSRVSETSSIFMAGAPPCRPRPRLSGLPLASSAP